MTKEQIPVLQESEPLLLFGGCYSNLQATQALFDEAQRLGIPPTRIICTGDVVAYAADPAATVDLVRTAGIHVVMGNCEDSLGTNAADCGCGFAAGSACDLLSVAWYAHADATLGNEARAWMRGLPHRIDVVIGGRRLAIIHGSPKSINEFVFASASAADLRGMIAGSGCDGVIGGHCGIPFTRVLDDLLWHNPGAIGIPANDGTPRVWFSVLEPLAVGIKIRHLELHYDYTRAAASMQQAGLPAGYSNAMKSRLWPSTDVLPPAELANTGVPIELTPVLWSSAAFPASRSRRQSATARG
jgi:predicted phosphodiesterase